MRKFTLVSIALFSVTAVLVTACAGGTSARTSAVAVVGSDGTQRVTVNVGNNMSFDPANVTVKAGQPVEVTLVNQGGMPHDFTLSDGVDQPVKITATAGESSTAMFTIARAGNYGFTCSMPGHAMAGMKGTITAQ